MSELASPAVASLLSPWAAPAPAATDAQGVTVALDTGWTVDDTLTSSMTTTNKTQRRDPEEKTS